MFLNKLRLLTTVYHKTNVINATIRQSKINLPSIVNAVRTYAAYVDDDDEDFPKRSNRNLQEGNPYRSEFNRTLQKKPFNAQRKQQYNREHGNDGFRNQKFRNPDYGVQRRSRSEIFNEGISKLQPIDFNQDELTEFKKNFYQPSENTLNRSDEEIAAFREKHEIAVPLNAPKPIFTFDELQNLPENVMKELCALKFAECTPIQAQGMPIALSGKNMVGIAQTGSGKTLAYIVPALIHILNQAPLERGDGPIALILAPTRELAQQIREVATQFGLSSNVRNTVLYGGAAKAYQLSDLEKGCELVVATPGRLIDLLGSRDVNLRRCSYLVLDEADRMLDMGFEPQMRQIVSQIRSDRQTLMWSATWPREVRNLANDFLGKSEYLQLTVGSTELSANHNIKQVIRVCDEENKYEVFLAILDDIRQMERHDRKTLIFAQTKRLADNLAYRLSRSGIQAEAIHGDRTQQQRERILNAFRNNRIDVLVATDVASRGLDVNNIKHVINYDFPNTCADYIHRIGRTGRAGMKGTAYTLFTEENAALSGELVSILEEAKQEIDPELMELTKLRYGKSKNFSKYRDY